MLHQLLTEKLAIEPRLHERLAMLVLAGKIDFNAIQANRAEPYFEREILGFDDDDYRPSGSAYSRLTKVKTSDGLVAIIPIDGTMSRNGDYCSWGTEAIGSWLMEAYSDPSVSGVVLKANSGGGSVDGTELLAEVVRQRTKPVVSLVTGMAASACYWVISQSDHIVMESASASEVGSIGVLAMHVDMSAAYESAGYKVTIIRADGSESKALFNSHEPLSKEVEDSVKAEMKPIRSDFIKQVKSGRPKITDNSIFSGGMYNGSASVKNGMADSIGFLGDAIARVGKLKSNYKSKQK